MKKTEVVNLIKGNKGLRKSLQLTRDNLDEATVVIKKHKTKFRQLSENSDLS